MKRHAWIALALVLATYFAYRPVSGNEFITFDDSQYITQNPHVLAGLTPEGVDWAFNVGYAGNWHPLTWLSHMLDVSLWGLAPGAHHATSLCLHIAAAVLLFYTMLRLTGRELSSAFVAAVFALHPLHVESVAWIAERKDILSALFGFAALWFWTGWVRAPRTSAYLLALGAYALSLASKPMFVTLPFLLLLLDFWPLARTGTASGGPGGPGVPAVPLAQRISEKLPFLALALGSCVLTMIAQSHGRAVITVADLSLATRGANALDAQLAYLEKAFWPRNLAIFYPYPTMGVPVLRVLLGSAVLAGVSLVALFQARRRPWFLVGWLWWLGMLVPVIGLVQVGGAAMADRYTYVPMVGISIVCAFGAAELLARWRQGVIAGWAAGAAVLLAWIVVTRIHVGYWKTDPALFRHALEVTDRNYLAHLRVGYGAWQAGRVDEALEHFDQAVRLRPDMIEARNNYGALLFSLDRTDEAIEQFSRAVQEGPDMADNHFNLGEALWKRGRASDAIASFRQGLSLRPELEERRKRLDEMIAMEKGGPASAPR